MASTKADVMSAARAAVSGAAKSSVPTSSAASLSGEITGYYTELKTLLDNGIRGS
jgi:hypothetical protein